MKYLIVALLALVFSSAANAQTLHHCYGAPDDYRAAFDNDPGPGKNVLYPEPRVYVEVQGWLTPFGHEPGAHSEHIHTGLCFPQGETWAQPNDQRTVHVKHIFHNVVAYRATSVAGSFVSLAGSGGGVITTQAHLDTINAAMAASANGTTTAYTSHTMVPSQVSGRQEFRFGLNVAATGPEALAPGGWFTDGRLYTTFNYAGLPDGGMIPQGVRWIRMRNWMRAPDYEGDPPRDSYHYVGIRDGSADWSVAFMKSIRPKPWNATLGVTDGGGPGLVAINPNFHVHPESLGLWHEEFYLFAGPGTDPSHAVSISLSGITGSRYLVIVSHEYPDCIRQQGSCPPGVIKPTSTSLLKMPFRAT